MLDPIWKFKMLFSPLPYLSQFKSGLPWIFITEFFWQFSFFWAFFESSFRERKNLASIGQIFFWTNQPTDRQTDRQTKCPIEAPWRSLKRWLLYTTFYIELLMAESDWNCSKLSLHLFFQMELNFTTVKYNSHSLQILARPPMACANIADSFIYL